MANGLFANNLVCFLKIYYSNIILKYYNSLFLKDHLEGEKNTKKGQIITTASAFFL